MTKFYYVEVKFGAKWHLVKSFTRHTDALHFVKNNDDDWMPSQRKYPIRIVRVTRTIVLEDKS